MRPSTPDKEATTLVVVSLSSLSNPASCQGLCLTQPVSTRTSTQEVLLPMEEMPSDLKSQLCDPDTVTQPLWAPVSWCAEREVMAEHMMSKNSAPKRPSFQPEVQYATSTILGKWAIPHWS